MRSDMVREEVRVAHDLSRRRDKGLVILPIRIAYQDALPYDLSARLDPIQYTLWQTDSDTAHVEEEIASVVAGGPRRAMARLSNPSIGTLLEATENAGIPLPRAEIPLETGAVQLNSRFYVTRKEDADVLDVARLGRDTIVVKGPRQAGKSSLLARVLAAGQREKVRVSYFDFQAFDAASFKDLGTLLRTMARQLQREFRIIVKPQDVWSPEDGEKLSFSRYLEQAILPPPEPRVMFLLDEVDRVFDHESIRSDFFSMVRYWHGQRAMRPDPWDRLTLVIAHSTEPALWIGEHESPFNVGHRATLPDFEAREIADLNVRYGRPLRAEEIPSLTTLVGGHPFLVRQALFCLVRNAWSLEDLRACAAQSEGPFGDHLKRYVWRLNRDEGLKASLQSILERGHCEEESHFQRLSAAGLVCGSDRKAARARCQLYADYFRKHL
jgi:hypothetical protein